MTFKERFEKNKQELLSDKSICKENRELFNKFFTFQEVKLRRMNGLSSLDEPTYKTLGGYIYRFRVVNGWFKNKPFVNITKQEFEKVFTDLADGKIMNSKGKPIQDVDSYVFKIFKSKLFRLAGLTNVVEESLEFYKSNNTAQCNFIEAKDMTQIIEHISRPKMKLLITLAFDIGENVSGLLQLRKRDCRKQFNEMTKDFEYLIHLRKDTLKRARLERTEPTRLNKSVDLLDFILKDLKDDDFIFSREDNMVLSKFKGGKNKNVPLGLRTAEIFFDRLVTRLKVKTIPKNLKPKLKDIRSSMACDCLKLGWSTEEINSRLGHSLTSKVLKPYVSFLALDKNKPKIREYKENIQGLNEKMQDQKSVNLLLDKRVKEQEEEIKDLKTKMQSMITEETFAESFKKYFSDKIIIKKIQK